MKEILARVINTEDMVERKSFRPAHPSKVTSDCLPVDLPLTSIEDFKKLNCFCDVMFRYLSLIFEVYVLAFFTFNILIFL